MGAVQQKNQRKSATRIGFHSQRYIQSPFSQSLSMNRLFQASAITNPVLLLFRGIFRIPHKHHSCICDLTVRGGCQLLYISLAITHLGEKSFQTEFIFPAIFYSFLSKSQMIPFLCHNFCSCYYLLFLKFSIEFVIKISLFCLFPFIVIFLEA